MNLEELKVFLKVEYEDEDALLLSLLATAKGLCADILRVAEEDLHEQDEIVKTAIMYAVGYLYENREQADFHDLTITLRSLFFGRRKEVF